MAPGENKETELEIGHVLFIDIVDYSKLLIEDQKERLRQLTEVVLQSSQVREATDEQLVRLPTGDGMALVFRHSAAEPARCALEVAEALKKHPEIPVRMGIHSGPVSGVTDVSGRANIAGAGINMAQRVMDCGDAGHILLSQRVADDLAQYRQWAPRLHDLGECEVKHGVRVRLVNFYSDELGNAEMPEKVRRGRAKQNTPANSRSFWIAVVPFKSTGDAEVVLFAEGLGEDISTGLSRFGYLSVIASASVAQLKGENDKVVGDKLGARYLLQGSIRKGGSSIRVTAQLVDVLTGTQLWAENYNRDLQNCAIFEAQDDIAARVVATVADSYGVLVHSMREASREKADADFTPAEWQFQWFAYREQITPASHGALRRRLERAVKSDNRPSDLWACLAQIYVDEYAFGFPGKDAASLDRALTAARRAVELDRANQFAMVALAQTHFFRQDLAAFAPAAERAMALNPLNTDALGILGLEIVHTGEFERGTAIVRRAMELNPNHAGWMHFAPLWNHFHQGEYERALECANRVDVPGLFWPFLVMASACGYLGRRAEAAAAVRDLLALDPEFAAHARSNVGTWHFASGLMEPILEGLRKAGLAIPETDDSSDSPNRSETVRAKAARTKSGTDPGAVRADEGFWVAVLPFKYSGGNPDIAALADGMTEGIVTGLSHFSYLRVIALGSTSRYANQAVDIRSAGKELGARYVIEGSLRQAGARLRVAVQLVDTISGSHLWAETYDRAFSSEEIFTLQDDLVPRIVSTVADMHGVLPRSMSDVVRQKSADQMSPYEALLRSFGYNERFTPEDLAEVRACLERAVQQAPNNAECWAMLSLMYANEYGHWDNAAPDSLDRSLRAARKAVEAAPLHSLPYYALAQALYFQKEFTAFRVAADRAISLNPMDGATAAFMGMLIAYSGDWERGCALSEKGCQLNPNHPGWYCYPAWHDAYRKKDYRKALDLAFQLNAPQNYYTHAVLAMCYAQLGRIEEARKAVGEMLSLKPNYAEVARELHGRWIQPDLVEQLMDGLRKAGLEISDKAGASAVVKASDSRTARADEGFWVAVLPFKYSGGNPDLTALAEGLTEEIITGLSRFSYLKVIARSSTARFAGESVDVRSAGRELAARYVMEGSLRYAGTKLRLAAQLVDAISGAHLWAENYERTFSPETVFEIQDELVPRIVSTVADMNGVLPRSMSENVRGRSPEELSPYEALLRSFGYLERVSAEELTAARSGLESAVRKAPAYGEAWAMLALLCLQDYAQGFNLQADSLASGSAAARRAVETTPSNHLAHFALAQALFFQKEFQSFRNAAERAVTLNPMDGNSIAFLGELLTYAGDWERGMALAERAKQLNPNHPGWYWYADFYNAYRQGNYRGALDFLPKSNLPGHWGMQAGLAAIYGQLGDRDAAGKALRNLLKLRPDFADTIHKDVEKWWEPEYGKRFIDGLRKAGLQIDDKAEASAARIASRRQKVDPQAETGATTSSAKSVAVLPFVNMSADKTDEYLSDGMTEELINALAKVPGLRVPGRTSCFAFKGKSEPDIFRKVGDQLHVSTVLEGSVRKAGKKLRVTAQLINVGDGYHLWSKDYDGEINDILNFQSNVAEQVVQALHVHLGTKAARALTKKPTENPEAHRLYLLGRYEFAKYTQAGWNNAIHHYEQALRLDPTFALAYCGLADNYAYMGSAVMPGKEANTKVEEFAQKALALDPELAEAHMSLAVALVAAYDWRNGLKEFDRALALNPNLAFAYELQAWTVNGLGRFEEALAKVKKSVGLDPLNPFFQMALSFFLYWAGQYDDAIAQARRTLEMDPNSAISHVLLGLSLLKKGDAAGAIAELQKAKAPNPGAWYQGYLGYAYATSGERAKAEQALRELEALAKDRYVSPTAFATIYLGLGENEKCLDRLEQSYEQQDSACWYLKIDQIYDSVRNDPRFHALVQKVFHQIPEGSILSSPNK